MYSKKSEYYDLPTKYNETIIRLLLQSPMCMYVYWEVSEDTIKNFSNHFSNYDNCIPILRIVNITENYSYEIPIDPYANNYYIHVEDTNCEYIVELGRKYKDSFSNIYTSNKVTVPKPAPHQTEEEIIFKNYICLSSTKKIKLYMPKHNAKHKQDYYNLSFSHEDQISSCTKYIN